MAITSRMRYLVPIIAATLLAFIAALIEVPTPTTIYQTIPGDSWGVALSLEHNSYHRWRIDPVILFGTKLSAITFGSPALPFIAFMLTLGFIWCLGSTSIASAVLASCITATLMLSIGNDLVTLQAVMWLPLLCGSMIWITQSTSRSVLPYLSAIALATRFIISANQLAFLIVGPLLWLLREHAAFSKTSLSKTTESATTQHSAPRAISPIVSLLLALGSLYVLCSAPYPTFPDYPGSAHVVPDDTIPGITRPLIGRDTGIPFVDHIHVRSIWAAPSLVLALLSLYVYGATQRRSSLPLWLSLSLVGDTLLQPSLAEVAPLAAITRILPGLTLFSLVPCVAALTTVALILSLKHLGAHRKIPLMLSLCLGLLARESGHHMGPAYEPFKKLSSFINHENLQHYPLSISPSFPVYRAYHFSQILEAPYLKKLSKKRIVDTTPIVASHNNDAHQVWFMEDHRENTRWSSGLGKQTGNESLIIDLTHHKQIRGIKLDVGDFITDYPRALQISHAPSCNAPSESWRVVAEHTPWEGVLQVTPAGYPYYGSQACVKVFFEESLLGGCIKVHQTGVNASFDWSVAEIFIYE
jgi:hypothetical protein